MLPLAILGFFLVPMVATGVAATLESLWCRHRRRMVVVAVLYFFLVVVPQYWIAMYYLLPMDRDYDPASWTNFVWVLAAVLLGRLVDLGYGPGRLFWNCWKAAGRDARVG